MRSSRYSKSRPVFRKPASRRPLPRSLQRLVLLVILLGAVGFGLHKCGGEVQPTTRYERLDAGAQ